MPPPLASSARPAFPAPADPAKLANRALRQADFVGPSLAVLALVASWIVLNLFANLRFSGRHFVAASMAPSLDIIPVLALVGFLAWRKAALAKWLRRTLVTALSLVTLVRAADGIQDKYFHRTFNFSVDPALLPEGVRLLAHTLGPWQFAFTLCVLGASLVLVPLAILQALKTAHWALGESTARATAFVIVCAALVISPWMPENRRYLGAFHQSIAPRFVEEVDFALHLHGYRNRQLQEMTAQRDRFAKAPCNLSKLEGNDVLLLLIESYGYTAFENPTQWQPMSQTLRAAQSQLESLGFASVSHFVDSPAYGVGSWYAHATLATGVRVSNQFQYRLLMSSDVPAMSGFFSAAGYRSVSVMPGTRRPWPGRKPYRFDQVYSRQDFNYAGPNIGWGELPDQYVIDFVRRRELGPAHPPTFLQFVLVSTHAPWAEIPTYLDDWNRIGNGAVYHELPITRRPLSWDNLEQAEPAYIEALRYDFEVVTELLTEHDFGDALIILMGDHQPVVQVSGRDRPASAPVHVISRRKDLLEPFAARGYTSGMLPRQPPPHPPMEDFLPQLLEDFSTPQKEDSRG